MATVVGIPKEVFASSDLIVKVKEPIPEEYDRYREGQELFTYLHLAADKELTEFLMERKINAVAYEPLTPGFIHVSPPDLYRRPDGTDLEAYGLECARDIERTMRWELPQTIAGVIMEPIITGGGILIPPENYLPAVKEICEESGTLLIVDDWSLSPRR